MNYLKQFSIILAISFVGEVLHYFIPLPIPASIYGLVLLFLALEFKIIPYEKVKDVSHFLIEIMPVMFIPAAVGLLDSWGMIASQLVPFSIMTIVTTIVVMAVAGRTTQFFIRKKSSSTIPIKDKE